MQTNRKALGLVVSQKIFFYVFPIVSLWELIIPWAGPFLTPKGMVGRIYKEDHYTLLHTKYESSGLCGFGEEDFLWFFHGTPWERPVWTPGARLEGFIKKDHYTLLNTKYKSSGPCGFGEKDFFYVSPL